MSRVYGPLFSLDASGTIAGAMTFSKWKGLNYVRLRVTPANPQTASQTSVRNTFKAGVSQWRNAAAVPAASKTSWDYYASGTGMSGFNRYMKKFVETNSWMSSPWTVPTPS